VTSFVTGATGFVGRHLVAELLRRPGTVHVLVREESRERLEALVARWGAPERVVPEVGDLTQPRLGLSEQRVAALRGTVDHLFHLAAAYDLEAPEERNQRLNVDGTREAVALANALEVGTFHHVSSVAVAGDHRGLFREDHFDEGQALPHPYHRSKFEAERIVREQVRGAWRVYRPSVIVGHSQTGEMDKVDGPYYFFKLIQRLRDALPPWVPLAGPELGYTNLVPVDYVARALDHIAHQPGLDRQAFHLADPRGIRVGEAFNAFARAAHAPQLAVRVDRRMLAALPKGVGSLAMQLPAVRELRRGLLADLGIPEAALAHAAFSARFDTRDAERALAGSGIAVPPLDAYADRLWDHWERRLDPDLHRDRSFAAAVNGRTVLITGASSGIGRATALKVAAAGGIPLLVARGADRLREVREEIEARGGSAHAYPADLADPAALDRCLAQVFADHAAVDYLVNNAGRSIRRSVRLSYDRLHDYERTMQLNYFAAIRLILGVLPHMRERGFGHVVNVSSIGVQASPPRFSAYVASKAALDAFTRVAATETLGDGVTFTTVHMPLVRTPMIAPTRIYDAFPTISPDEAADLVCEAIRSRPKRIGTRLGTFAEVAHAVAPRAADRILHMAYRAFPESAAATGRADPGERASTEQVALAHLLRGVHW
jgi:thioester reductase-like protein